MIKLTDKDVSAISNEIHNTLSKEIVAENSKYSEEREKQFLETEEGKQFDKMFASIDTTILGKGHHVKAAREVLKGLVLGEEKRPRVAPYNLNTIIRLIALRVDDIDQLFEEATKSALEKTYV